jgi:AsmA protein
MNRTLRTVLIVVAVLVVLLLVAPFLIPVDSFRPTIEEKASAAIGRQVQLGHLSLSLLGGSLSAENLSVGDDLKFSKSPFLTAKSVKVGVEVMPLIFSKTVNVTGITIENPEVTLLRNPAGVWNYSSLGTAVAKSEQASKPAASRTATSPSSPTELSVKKLELKDGRIVVGTTNSQKHSAYDHVNVTLSDVSVTSKFPIVVTADLPGGGKFKLEGTAGPVDQADSSLTPVDAKLTVSALNLASTGFVDATAGLGGLLDLDATVTSQNGEAETKGAAKLSKALFVAGGSPSSEPVTVDFNTKYNLRKNSGVLNPSDLKIGKAVARLNGTYQTEGEATVLSIKVTGENMPAHDLETFLPALGVNLPKGSTLQGGTLSTNLNVSGPTSKLVTIGNVGLFKTKLAGFDLGSKMSAISALTGMKTGKDLDIEKITTNLHMSPTGIQAENFIAVLPSIASIAGGGTVDSKNNLDFKMAATLTNALGAAGSPVSSATGMLGKLTGGGGAGGTGSGCKQGTTVPFLIQGTTSDPKFVPDVGGLAAGMLKSQLGCAAGALPGAKGQPGQAPNPVDTITGLFGKKKKP